VCLEDSPLRPVPCVSLPGHPYDRDRAERVIWGSLRIDSSQRSVRLPASGSKNRLVGVKISDQFNLIACVEDPSNSLLGVTNRGKGWNRTHRTKSRHNCCPLAVRLVCIRRNVRIRSTSWFHPVIAGKFKPCSGVLWFGYCSASSRLCGFWSYWVLAWAS